MTNTNQIHVPLGIGFYTVPEAARLLRVRPVNIRRWLGGYTFKDRSHHRQEMPPLWEPQLPQIDEKLFLGFRDLIELRFVSAFLEQGVSLQAIRICLESARELVGDERPFATRRFRTDGKTIFLDSLDRAEGGHELLDLRRRQFVIATVLERTFKDLDIEADAVIRWRPFKGRCTVVVDPKRAFGQPITNEGGVPTVALAQAVKAEGSVERVAYLYGVSNVEIRDAVEFQRELQAA